MYRTSREVAPRPRAIDPDSVRLSAAALALVAVLGAPASGWAQETSAGGWLGVGAFGPHLATTVDVGVDVADESYAVGIGGRLRYLAGEGLRREDWDDLSELLHIMRYAIYRRSFDDDSGNTSLRLSAAAGALGGVALGHGAVIDGYATGVDVDHGRVGAQARVDGGLFGFEALVDDLAAPRVVAARSQWRRGDRTLFGFSVIGDLSAPSGPVGDAAGAESSSEVLPFAVADAEYRPELPGRRFEASTYVELVSVIGVASGAHAGATGAAAVGGEAARVTARGELRLGSDGYLAGWIGPLYDLARETRLAEARAGGMAGLGGLAEVGLELPGIGSGSVTYSRRPGAEDLASVRLAVPHLRGAQGALWGAAELGDAPDRLRAMGFELRARLPAEMFVVLEASHLYRRTEVETLPIWIATAAVGGVVGE